MCAVRCLSSPLFQSASEAILNPHFLIPYNKQGIVIAREAGCVVVGSQSHALSSLASSSSFGAIPPEVLTGRKYVVLRPIGDTSTEKGADAQKRILKEFYGAIEEWDP